MMKHRAKKLILMLVAAIALLGVAAAVVLGGTASDPLISQTYLNETYLPAQAAAVEQRMGELLNPVYEAAAARLSALAEGKLGQIAGREFGMTTAAAFTPLAVKERDILELQGGASVLMTFGGASVSAGALIDLTEGGRHPSGSAIKSGHRYLTDGAARATVTMTGTLGSVAVQGNYRLWPSAGRVMPFSDVKAGDWFYPAVQYAYDTYTMGGVSDTRFSPTGSMTRAMLATVLHRMQGAPAPTAPGAFTDVEPELWYTAAVDWAAEVGVVNGLGDGVFGPDRSVTREQLAVMLHRYGQYLQREDDARASLGGFSDGGAVAAWSAEAVEWSVAAGIITGRNNGTLDPGGTAMRAEVATMLQRFAVWFARGSQ